MREKLTILVITIIMTLGMIPVISYGAESNWAVSYDVTYINSAKEYKLTNVLVDTRGNTTGNISITYPNSIKLKDTSPSGWDEKTKSESRRMTNSDRTVAYSIEQGATAAQIKAYLESIVFEASKVNNKYSIRVAIDESTIATVPYAHADGTTHYYRFVPTNATTDDRSYQTAYNDSKSSNYLGYKGYLTTITSTEEQNFIWNSIATTSGYLGGVRVVYDEDGAKIGGRNVNTIDQSKITMGVGKGSKWYWTSGPEAGQVFYNTPIRDDINGPVTDKYSIPWNNGEPNNSKANNTINPGEGYLQFAYNNQYWNDTGGYGRHFNYNEGATGEAKFIIFGYYVEFGGYSEENPAANGSTYATAKGKSLAYAYEIAQKKNFVYDYSKGNLSKAAVSALLNVQFAGIDSEDISLTINSRDLEALNRAIDEHKKKTYTIRYTTEAGERFLATITLKGDNLTGETNKIIVPTDKVISKEEIINLAGIILTDADKHPLDPSEITVDEDQLEELNTAIKNKKAGEYKVTLYASDGTPYIITVTIPENKLAFKESNGKNNPPATGDEGQSGLLILMIIAGCILLKTREKNN